MTGVFQNGVPKYSKSIIQNLPKETNNRTDHDWICKGNCERKRIKFSHPGHPPVVALPEAPTSSGTTRGTQFYQFPPSHGSLMGLGSVSMVLTGRIAVCPTTGAETMAKQSCGHFKIRYCSLEPNKLPAVVKLPRNHRDWSRSWWYYQKMIAR